jgi:uncharacterized protein (DUF427 family)
MSLTMGTSPFGHRPWGRFDFDAPHDVVYVEPFPRRVRGYLGDEAVVDSDATKLVMVSRSLARYSFPAADVTFAGAVPDPHVDGHVTVDWNALDRWLEEDEEVFVHPRDPYHRIVVARSARRVVVLLDGTELATSTAARGLWETGLPVRWYLPRGDVQMELLEPSETITHCAYKGTPVHYSARTPAGLVTDVGWSYVDDVTREAEDISGYVAFYNERVDIEVAGVRLERPQTPWSR